MRSDTGGLRLYPGGRVFQAPGALPVYTQWKADKQAVDCFWSQQYDNNYKRWKCYDDLKKSRQ
jgi:hypothetical protein